jgi:hypothetical protein
VHREAPLYREAAIIDPDGMEIVRIVEDRILDASELRDVSKPENTTYRSERYFEETLKVKTGEIYVSHVTGWFVTLEEQLHRAQSIEDAVEGRQFEGVIRFAAPCMGDDGGFEGLVLLSLDHRSSARSGWSYRSLSFVFARRVRAFCRVASSSAPTPMVRSPSLKAFAAPSTC